MAVVVDPKTKLTYEDYLQFPEDGRRHEIISEYWIVDPERKVVQQYVLTDGVFRSAGEHADRIALACIGTAGGEPVQVDLSEVW